MITMYSMIATTHSKFHLNLWKKHGQPLNPNYYSNKTCACCGTYHGFCNLKYNYTIFVLMFANNILIKGYIHIKAQINGVLLEVLR